MYKLVDGEVPKKFLLSPFMRRYTRNRNLAARFNDLTLYQETLAFRDAARLRVINSSNRSWTQRIKTFIIIRMDNYRELSTSGIYASTFAACVRSLGAREEANGFDWRRYEELGDSRGNPSWIYVWTRVRVRAVRIGFSRSLARRIVESKSFSSLVLPFPLSFSLLLSPSPSLRAFFLLFHVVAYTTRGAWHVRGIRSRTWRHTRVISCR